MMLHPSWWFGRTGKPGFLKPEESSGSGKRFRDDVLDGSDSSVKNVRLKLLYFMFFHFGFQTFNWVAIKAIFPDDFPHIYYIFPLGFR